MFLWENSVKKYPNRLALVGANQEATYQQADQYIEEVTKVLKQVGVGSGKKVALFFGNEPNFVIALFAIFKSGGIACPLNPNLTISELDQLLNVIKPDIAIAGANLPELKQHLSTQLVVLELENWQLNCSSSAHVIPFSNIEPELENVACILCTSGTTGLPKAAMLTHTNLSSNAHALWANKIWLDEEIFGNALPVFHIYGITVLTLVPLLMGGTVVFMPRFSPESCLRTIEKYKITRFGGVPSMFVMLNKYSDKYGDRLNYDVSSCQSWISGGAPLASSVVEEFFEKFGQWIYEGYGMLETSPGISWNLDDSIYHKGAVGRPLQGVEIKICDSFGSQLSVEEIGEVWIKSLGVMKGYYRNPIATEEAIQNGYLRTEDLGKIDADGYLYLMGRSKDLIIVGGHNVYPREIETVLLDNPSVADVAVVGIEDKARGEQIFAFIVPLGEAQISEQSLIQECRQTLSSFKVPRHIYFVKDIPRNDSGKILKKSLIEIHKMPVN